MTLQEFQEKDPTREDREEAVKYIKDYLIELRQQGILDTEEEIDLSGMIGAINAIAKSEEGDSFVPYTLQDACMINFRFEYVIDFNTLMRSNNRRLGRYRPHRNSRLGQAPHPARYAGDRLQRHHPAAHGHAP